MEVSCSYLSSQALARVLQVLLISRHSSHNESDRMLTWAQLRKQRPNIQILGLL